VINRESNKQLEKYIPRTRVIIISLGPKKAIVVKGETVYLEGMIASKIKSLVEMKIMRNVNT